MRLAASRIFCTAGNSRPIKTAMIAITTSNSISVKALPDHQRIFQLNLGMAPPPERGIRRGVQFREPLVFEGADPIRHASPRCVGAKPNRLARLPCGHQERPLQRGDRSPRSGFASFRTLEPMREVASWH